MFIISSLPFLKGCDRGPKGFKQGLAPEDEINDVLLERAFSSVLESEDFYEKSLEKGVNDQAVVTNTALLNDSFTIKVPRKYYEPKAGFSFDPPEGWEDRSQLGFEHRVFYEPQPPKEEGGGFSANINIVGEAYEESPKQYWQYAQKLLKEVLGGKLTVISQEDFETDDGNLALKVVTLAGHTIDSDYLDALAKINVPQEFRESLKTVVEKEAEGGSPKHGGSVYLQTAYIFSNGSFVHVLTCTALPTVGVTSSDNYSVIFDKVAKSFRLH